MEGGNNCSFPVFLKVYIPDSSSQKMQLPPAFVQRVPNGLISMKLYLRNRCGERWAVILGSIGTYQFFQGDGWIQFVRDNNLVEGNFLMFYFNGLHTFDFKIFENNGCEKIDGDDDDDDDEVVEINEADFKNDNAEEEEEREKEVEKDDDDEDYDNTLNVIQVTNEDEEEHLGKRKKKGKAKQGKLTYMEQSFSNQDNTGSLQTLIL